MTHRKKTLAKIEQYTAAGYTIIEGNNWRLDRAKKYRQYDCVRLAQTNSMVHGRSVNTVWAVKQKEGST